MEGVIVGALAGWRRTETDTGIVLKLKVAVSAIAAARREYETAIVALDDRQLRSLTRDLARAAGERGIELWPRRRGMLARLTGRNGG